MDRVEFEKFIVIRTNLCTSIEELTEWCSKNMSKNRLIVMPILLHLQKYTMSLESDSLYNLITEAEAQFLRKTLHI